MSTIWVAVALGLKKYVSGNRKPSSDVSAGMPASTVFWRWPTIAAFMNSSAEIEGNALFTAAAVSLNRQPSMIRSTACSLGAFSNTRARSRGVSAAEIVYVPDWSDVSRPVSYSR